MTEIDEIWVRSRAQAIWEAEGKPHGKETDHWYAAVAEFRAQIAVPVKKKAAAAKKVTAPEAVPAKPKSARAAKVAPVATPEAVAATEQAPAPKKRTPAAKKPKA